MNKIFSLNSLIPLLAVLCGACDSPAYKLVNVPYCKVAEGAARSGFQEGLAWVYKSGDAGGSGPIVGDWPKLGLGAADSVTDAKTLLAVVSCPKVQGSNITTISSEPVKAADGLTAEAVPVVCPGQQVLFHGPVTATDDPAAKAKGYAGVIKFPDIAATCPAGTLTKTTSADIEQRPK